MRGAGRDVIWIRSPIEIVGVAAIAIRGCSREPVPYMALYARQRGMSPGQRKARKLRVIEPRILPHGHAMACLAGRW